MKKLTLISLLIFVAIVSGIFGMNLAYPPVQTTQTSSNEVTILDADLTLDEVATHNAKEDCYLVVDNKVYDVSTYIRKHPGGSRSITSRCGKEVTSVFASIHSNFAWDLLGDYYIGLVSEVSTNISTSEATLNAIEEALMVQYPGAEIINVKPKTEFYLAKLIYKNALYEIHIDASGKVLSEEIENDEFDWSNWDADADDL